MLYSPKNFRILFLGNLNYLPNILACKDFIENTLPPLIRKIPNIKFCIVGDLKNSDKRSLSKNKNVEVIGSKKNISSYVKNSICGLANLGIATGIQVKVLSYMTYGLPVICSRKVSINFKKNVLEYNSNDDLVRTIVKLKNKKIFWNRFSKKSVSFVKNFKWKNVSKKYFHILNSQ